MTRGVIITKCGGKYISVGYSNSDSYPSGEIGQMFVRAFEAPSDEETANIINAYTASLDGEDSQGCWRCLLAQGEGFYDKKKAASPDEYYYDYAYVYDVKAKSLKIYRYGEWIYTFKKSEVRYLKVLTSENQLWFAFSYDDKIKDTVGDDRDAKKFRQLMHEGKSPEEILAIADGLVESIHYTVSSYKTTDCWEDSYIRTVTLYPTKGGLNFIFENDRGRGIWNIYLQLPWVRVCIDPTDYKSERAAMKGLFRLLDKQWASLQNGLPMYKLFEKYRQKLTAFFDGCDKVSITEEEYERAVRPIEQEFKEKVAVFADTDLSGYCGHLSVKKAKREIQSWIDNARRHIFVGIQGAAA